MNPNASFDLDHVLHDLSHYLPAQSPLKDFVHHNTLHAFQDLPFHMGLQVASETFGYKVYWDIENYRDLYRRGKIHPDILERVIKEKKGDKQLQYWKQLLLDSPAQEYPQPTIGQFRKRWREAYNLNLDKEVHQTLFRLISSYLDQGIAIWKFPAGNNGLLDSLRKLEAGSFTTSLKSLRARDLLFDHNTKLEDLLAILVGKEEHFAQYLFDQQFAHPGWSGMVAVLEHQPQTLLDQKRVSLHDMIFLECLLEIDALDRRRKDTWAPLAVHIDGSVPSLFKPYEPNKWYTLLSLWQEALEWSYYDQVIKGLQTKPLENDIKGQKAFQAIFCIDDRECSIRRYIERFAPDSETFGTAGFFNLPFYFQPEHGRFMTKVCPAPMTPKHVIIETDAKVRHRKDANFSKHSKGIFGAWAISQTMGFWTAIEMAKNILRPGEIPAMVSSFKHMDPNGCLSVVCTDPANTHKGLQVGFTLEEMTSNLEGMLKSIGLVKDFAPFIYMVGHGASSVNNTHYAGYDCGACSGRSGSVNARVISAIGNNPEVRERLRERGIDIPDSTKFIGGLHDTTRDEMEFYDLDLMGSDLQLIHERNRVVFETALNYNAKERSRRFHTIDSSQEAVKIHEQVKLRALSLFEPRPEWNHATNALCVVGKRANNKHLFLDKRAFLNSYDHSIDPEGHYLLGILKAVAPVCGGINLEYYFSKVDNHMLGAGTKLPHNVMGLIGVANGMDGDLRTGLPLQMVNIHDPLRILILVEHYPEVLMKTIQTHEPTFQWFANEWVRLACIHPDTKDAFVLKEGEWIPYVPITDKIEKAQDLDRILESNSENLPVYLLS